MPLDAGVVAALLGLFALEPGDLGASGEPGLNLVVRCAGLSDEARAAVEARVRADLLGRGIERGMLVLECSNGGAQSTWLLAGAPAKTLSRELSEVESQRVEQLVQLAADGVTHEQRASSRPSAEANAEPPAAAGPVATRPVPAPAARDETRAPSPSAPKQLPRSKVMLVAGPSFEFWGTEAPGALGLRAGVAVPFERVYSVQPLLAYEVALTSPGGVTTRQLFGSLEFFRELGAFLTVGLGVAGSLLTVSAPPGATPASRVSALPALTGCAAVPVRLGQDSRAVFTLGARAYSKSRDIHVDGARVLSVPALTLLLAADLRLGL